MLGLGSIVKDTLDDKKTFLRLFVLSKTFGHPDAAVDAEAVIEEGEALWIRIKNTSA